MTERLKRLVDGVIVDMTPEEEADHLASLPQPVPPPLVPITRRQLRLTLLAHDYLDHVEPALAALPQPQRAEATIEWQDASEYRRDHQLIVQIGAALGLSEPQIDAMWREAMAR